MTEPDEAVVPTSGAKLRILQLRFCSFVTFIFVCLLFLFLFFFYKEARIKQPSFTAPQLQPWSSLSLVILLFFLFKNVTGGRTVGPYRLILDQN